MNAMDQHDDVISLLGLDGGGPGSLSQLRILGEYISRLAYEKGVDVDSLLPADLFDMIGAVGFGAYVALLLGPLRTSVSQAIEELIILGTTLFPPDQEEIQTTKENSRKLKEAVEGMLGRQQLPVDIKLKDDRLPGSHSKVVIFATPCANTSHCVSFRTYASREQSVDCTLVEAACATLAIPSPFDPVSIGPRFREKKYSSACIGFNNITRELLKEAGKQFGQNKRVSTILSVGSGHSSITKIDTSSSHPDGYGDLLKRIVTDTEKVARELSSQLFNVDAYLRLNVDYGTENIGLTDWNGLGEIESQTDVYLQGAAVSNAIDSSLRTLQDKIGLITLEQLNRSTGVKVQAKAVPAVSPYFVVRKELWIAMEQHLIISPEAKRKIMVLSGMGGCGKTQMVAYFVEKYHSQYQHIFFVDASSDSSIQADLQSAIRALGVGYEQKTFEDAVAFLQNGSHDGNWLVIFDNADNPTLNLIRYLPVCFYGTIIITTRNPGLGRLNTTTHLQLGPMGDGEAYEALVRAAHRTLPLSPNEDASVKGLMVELGSLAVALVQAGSYCFSISATRNTDHAQYTFEQYLGLFKHHRKELMTRGDTNSLYQYTRGAYTTFNLSYSLLSQSARELLHLCGYFHHTDISLSMLEYAARTNFSDWYEYLARPESHSAVKERLKTLLCPSGMWNELSIHDTIHSLQPFSLASTTATSGSIFLRFHPLVHVWSRDVLPISEESSYRDMAMQIVVSCTNPSNKTLHRSLLPHITVFLEKDLARKMHINDKMGFGRVFRELGEYSRAESLFQDILANMKTLYGGEHVATIGVTTWLAWTYHREGRWKKAAEMQLECLERYRKLLGKNHLDTITAAANLARTYRKQGKWKEAEKIEVEVLEQSQRLLSKDHPYSIRAAANLSAMYQKQGKWKEAQMMQVDVLEQRQQLRGKDDLDTITAVSWLATTYRKQGKLKEAEMMQVEVLEQRQRLLSKDHPDTITAAAHLASTYSAQGKWKEAEKMQVEVLEQRRRLLSSDHPDTLHSVQDLACNYHCQGRYAKAEELQAEAVEAVKRVLGDEHPYTIIYIKNLDDIHHSRSVAPKLLL